MPTGVARPFALLFLAGAAAANAQSADVRPCLRSGEVFTFVVKALGMQGGHLKISTSRDAGEGRISVIASMATEGFPRSIYKYENVSVSLVDAESGFLVRSEQKGIDGSKLFDRVTDLDHAANGLNHTDHIRPRKSYQAALPAGLVDLSVTMLCARSWNLAVGESRAVALTYEGLLYDLDVKALREEDVKTPLGRFRVVVLEPTPRGAPEGAFKKGTAFRMYLTRENAPRLVRFDSMASAVTLVALLEKVEEGTPVVANP